jgi:hypothetical protein
VGTVLVIGAQGVLGSNLVGTLEERGWEVLRGARRPDAHGAHRAVDLDRPDTVASAIAEVDLSINVVPHPELTAERLALRDGGVLVDISARPAAMGRRLREEKEAARGVVLLNAGRTPGVSNLLAADLLAAYPDADMVEIAFSFSASGVSGTAGGVALHRLLSSRRAHRTAVLPFPPPTGTRRCLQFAQAEEGWLGELADGRAVATYARFAPRAVNRAVLSLNALHLMSVLPRALFVRGKHPAPANATHEPVTEWVAVLRHGTRLAAATIEGEGGYRITATATAVFASALLDAVAKDPELTGCFDPQELFTLQQLGPHLRKAGINILHHEAPGSAVAQPVGRA